MDTDWTFSSQSWLWDEDVTFKNSCSGSDWSREEDKAFENALAIYYNDAHRWEKIALAVPGKTIEDIKLHYEALSDDVAAIESGKVPFPSYPSKVGDRRKRKKSPEAGVQRGVPWTEEEHRRFLYGLQRFGRGDWKSISRYSVRTKSNSQVASHAQKYFKRLKANEGKRPSINDIRSVKPESLLALEKATTSCMPKHPKEKSTSTGNHKPLPKNSKKASTKNEKQLLPGYPMEPSTNAGNQLLPVSPKEASSSAGNEPLPGNLNEASTDPGSQLFKGYPKDASTSFGNELLPIYPKEASTNPGNQPFPVYPNEASTTGNRPGHSKKAPTNAGNQLLRGCRKKASTKAGKQLLKGYPKEASTNAEKRVASTNTGYPDEASTNIKNQLFPGYPKEASANAENQLLKRSPKEASTNAGKQQLPGYLKETSTNFGSQLLPGYLNKASINLENQLVPGYPEEVSTNTVNQLFPGYPNEALTNIGSQLLPPTPFAAMSVHPFPDHATECSMFTNPFSSELTQEPDPTVEMTAYHPPFALIQDGGVPSAGLFDIPSTSYSEILDLDEFVFPHFLD